MTRSVQPEICRLSSDTVISVRNVAKSYRLYSSNKARLKEALHPLRRRYHEEFWALQGVSFDILRGQSVGILGRNGAGKSTLLQLIAGVLTPTSGNISVLGKVSALLELGAGFNPDLTGRENVMLSSTILGVPEKAMAEHVATVEAFADIGAFFDQPMKVYSSGMYARVAFANAIQVDPDVLIVDEILGVGDAKFQEKCYSKIRSLREKGVCILFVSHSTEVIQRNCERALLLEGGRLVQEGASDAVVAAYHDLLYGSRTAVSQGHAVHSSESTRSALHSGNPAQVSELKAFLDGADELFCRRFPYYNAYVRRFGNKDAEIVDFLVSADGNFHFNVLNGDEQLAIYLKVYFNRVVDVPRIGWALASAEAIVIAGSNTVMKNIQLPPAGRGETWVYAIKIDSKLCGGQYFLNFGIGDHDGESWIVLDEMRAAAHLSVADSGKASGFFQTPSDFEVILRPEKM